MVGNRKLRKVEEGKDVKEQGGMGSGVAIQVA